MVHVDEVRLPSGKVLDSYHVVAHPFDAVTVVVTNREDELLFVRVARYATDSDGWELPAGGIDDGEPSVAAAAREVEEETGYTTTDHEHILTFHPTSGTSSLTAHVVRCFAGATSGRFDLDEVQEVQWFKRDEVRMMVANGAIRDGFTLVALLADDAVPPRTDGL